VASCRRRRRSDDRRAGSPLCPALADGPGVGSRSWCRELPQAERLLESTRAAAILGWSVTRVLAGAIRVGKCGRGFDDHDAWLLMRVASLPAGWALGAFRGGQRGERLEERAASLADGGEVVLVGGLDVGQRARHECAARGGQPEPARPAVCGIERSL
jgi:hypothetical protein